MELRILVAELDNTTKTYKYIIDGNSHEARYKQAVELAQRYAREGFLAAPGSGDFKLYPASRVLMVTYGREAK